MKQLTIHILNDGRFVGQVTHDGLIVAAAEGQGDSVTCRGQAGAFAEILGVMGQQVWTMTEQLWKVSYRISRPPHGWGFEMPNKEWIGGFESSAAARSAATRLQPMYGALECAPLGLYLPFLTHQEGWGFFDRQGELHATFQSKAEADGCAVKTNAGGAV